MTCQLSAISHECWDSVWSSFLQEKIWGLIDDVCHVSIRNAQQPGLRALSLHKDYIYWGLEHIFFNFPGITCLVPTFGMPRASGSSPSVFSLLLSLELIPDPTQLSWCLAFCLTHCQRLPSDLI